MSTTQVENLYTPGCIRTFSGKYFSYTDMHPDTILIEDIAHALANIPRFAGHTDHFYSVAQHSVMVMLAAPADHKFDALMHDAAEAYMLDIPSPLKALLPDYKGIEHRLMHIIAAKFGFEYPKHKYVDAADKYAMEQEWKHCVIGHDGVCWSPAKAEAEFLNFFRDLTIKPKGGAMTARKN